MHHISENPYYFILLDTETTGFDPLKHRIAEIAFRIIEVNSGEEIASYESLIRLSENDWKNASPRALEVNGITWEELVFGKDIQEVAKNIEQIFIRNIISGNNAKFLCQNPSFDRPFFNQVIPLERQGLLRFPYHWLDLASMDVALRWRRDFETRQEHRIESLSKDNIAHRLNIGPEAMPHKAMNGVNHLLKIYEKMIGFPKKDLLPQKIVTFELPHEDERKRKRERPAI